MQNEFTAVIEKDGDWYVAYCPEIPGANGQGRTMEECRASLADAIELILEDAETRPARTDKQRQELKRRIAEDDAFPNDVVPWEQVKAELLAKPIPCIDHP